MSVDQLTELHYRLLDARIEKHALDATEFENPDMLDAYIGQAQLIQQYCQETGTRFSGWKVALSGAPARARYGLQQPVYGQLCTDMQLKNASQIALKSLYQPKLEVELAFILNDAITETTLNDTELLAKVGDIHPAIEIADTRWLNWNFQLGQFLVDNAAAQFYVLGHSTGVPVQKLDVQSLIDHASVEISITTQPEDQPVHNYLWLVRSLLAQGKALRAGDVILTGSIIRPMELQAGNYEFHVLGQQVSLHVT